jgi:CubicO group peptidase (beta-lactamase class C family)/Tol biopolymer transport system component
VRSRTRVALPLLIIILVMITMVVAACADRATTTTSQAATTTSQAATTTTQAAVTTTQPPGLPVTLAPDRKGKLDEFLGQLEKHNKLMGGVVIAQDGQRVYENYIGSSSLADGLKNGPLTKFRIGSITKMFTATMVMQLVEEGRLTLDTKLASFYPQIQNADTITISEMLSHRSGIHDFTDDPGIVDYMYSKQSKDQMLARFAAMEPDFQPGEQFAYSNTNYVLLGWILEDITQSTYEQALKTKIVDRIGLANTDYGSVIDAKAGDAASYAIRDGQWVLQRESDTSVPSGAGAIVSTPRDLTAFIVALFGGELVSEASLNQMLDMRDGYGLGIAQGPGEPVSYGHGGEIDAFSSILAYFPEEKVAVALLVNGVDGSLEDVMTGIKRTYFNLPYEIPAFAPLPAPTVVGTLAFSKPVGEGNADIYVTDTDGSGQRPVADTDAWEGHPSWSPDGSRIVYHSVIPGTLWTDSVAVWVARADGSERTQLSDARLFNPTWSPDGKHVVNAAVVKKESAWLSLFVINPDGSGAKDLFDEDDENVLPFPSWAPNGDVLFLRDWDLYSMKPDGTATVRLTTGKDIGGYALSPDGRTLAYWDRGEKAILTMPLDAGGPSVRLLDTAWLIQFAPCVALSWSPDGKALAIASSEADDAKGSPIYVVNADGSGLSQVPGVEAAYDPVWRPK